MTFKRGVQPRKTSSGDTDSGDLQWFDDSEDPSMEHLEKIRKLRMGEDCNPLFNSFKDMWLAQIPPAHRVLDKQYRETGVLLPYGANTNKFCKPNT
jgi:hypothetical protein